ncbi:hypothetical protein R6Q59_013236, partial [Mikania micrantha]
AEENSISCLKRGLDVLNNYLASHTFLVGDGITLADIITICNLVMAFQYLMTKSLTSDYLSNHTLRCIFGPWLNNPILA